MSIREMLAHNLAFYRTNAGLTQQSAADLLGTKKTTLSSWERGVSQPSADMLVSIAKAYKVPLSILCGSDYQEEYSPEERMIMRAYRYADELEKMMARKVLNVREKKDSPVQKEA